MFILHGKLNLLFTDKIIFDDNAIKFIIRNEIDGKIFYHNSKLILALDMQNLSKEIFNEFVEFVARFTILN